MKKNTNIYRLIVSNVLKKSGTAAIFMFLNIFIWKELGDFQVLILFNICYMVIHTITFVGFSGIIKNGMRRELLFISLFLFALIFFALSIFNEYLLENIYYIGAVLGLANGMYWVTFNNNYFDLTNHKNRGYYSGLRGSLNTVGKIITPALIGAIISWNYNNLGYQGAFLIGAIMFIISAFLGNVEIPERKKREYKFFKATVKILNNKKIFWTYFFYMIIGFAFSNILLDTLLPLLMYIEVEAEYKLGFLIGIFSLLSVIVSYIIGKYIPYLYYKKLIIFTGISYTVTMISMLLFPEYIVVFTAILSALFVVYSVPVRVIIQNIFHEVKGYEKIVSENTALQEIYVMTGRIGALISLYFIGSLQLFDLKYVFSLMIFMIITSSIYFSSVDISIEPKHK